MYVCMYDVSNGPPLLTKPLTHPLDHLVLFYQSSVTAPGLVVYGSIHTMLAASVEANEQGLAAGFARGQELAPDDPSTIITTARTDHVPEPELEPEQGLVPDDDWTDVFTLLCGGEDEGQGLA